MFKIISSSDPSCYIPTYTKVTCHLHERRSSSVFNRRRRSCQQQLLEEDEGFFDLPFEKVAAEIFDVQIFRSHLFVECLRFVLLRPIKLQKLPLNSTEFSKTRFLSKFSTWAITIILKNHWAINFKVLDNCPIASVATPLDETVQHIPCRQQHAKTTFQRV